MVQEKHEAVRCSGKILVVEDEIMVRFPICEFLRDAGVTVIEAGHADEALEYLATDRDIHLVFSDIRMPGSMDGVRLAERIKNDFPDVQVILTSAYLPEGVDPRTPILAKPYHLDSTTERLCAALAEINARYS